MVNWLFDSLLRRTSVRTRVIGSFMLIMLFAGSIAPIILFSLNTLVNRLDQVTNVDVKIERLLLTASRRVVVSQLNLNRYIQDLTPSPFEALDDSNQALRDLKEAESLAANPEQMKTIGLVIRSLEVYRQKITDLQKAQIQGNNAEVTRLQSQLQQLGNDISARLEGIAGDNVKQVAATNEEVLNDAQRSSQTGLILMTIGFILAFVFSALISISIARPLAELRKGAETFQKGDMEYAISTAGSDEFTVIARIFNELTQQISGLIASLENRVVARTAELNTAVKYIDRRAKQFEAVTKVSQSISASTRLQELLPYISEVVSEQFGFYHVGIFLNDDNNQYAILAAANSAGGKRMLGRGHQLKIGEQGIVGYATSTGTPRIALDVGQDVVYFNNPDLPETHSEMALPLRIAGKIAGALDIQSTESNAFSNDDIEVLSALADQVGLAIQNARLYDQTQKTLAEAEMIQRQYLRETWSRLPREEKFAGFRYSALGATVIKIDEDTTGRSEDKKLTAITVPIVLRGETIGTLTVQTPRHERITSDQMDLIKAVTERVALSAENARLFDETTRRAERERIVSDISSKIGSSFQTESILQTTATELSQLIENADIIIKLQPPQSEAPTKQLL
jgi:GAF domain-containing protein/HAMP domain-containing protein